MALTLIFQVYISNSQDRIAILVDAWAGTGRTSDDSSFMFPVNFGGRVGLDEADEINGPTDGGDFILLLCGDLWWFQNIYENGLFFIQFLWKKLKNY